MIKNTCPFCGRILQFPDSYAGEPANCDRCGGSISVPGAGQEGADSTEEAKQPDGEQAAPSAGEYIDVFPPEPEQQEDTLPFSPSLARPSEPEPSNSAFARLAVKGLVFFILLAAIAAIMVGLLRAKDGGGGTDSGLFPVLTSEATATAELSALEQTEGETKEKASNPEQNAVRVTFADQGLEAAVRRAIQKPTGKLFVRDLIGAKLTSLDATKRGITSLSGIEYCANLTRLELRDNKITDITPLTALKKLTWLRLARNEIRDIAPLQELKTLRVLDMEGNHIVSLRPLGDMPQLTTLSLVNNGVYDIAPLAALADLGVLLLDENQIADISPLAELKNLKSLTVRENLVADLTPLSGLTKLETLVLSKNQIRDVSPLVGLPHLQELELANNQIADVSPLLKSIAFNKRDRLDLQNNPLEPSSVGDVVANLKARGVSVKL